MEVVSLGAGTAHFTKVSPQKAAGNVILDCHAEILARRAWLKWLYGQINKLQKGEPSVVQRVETPHVNDGDNPPLCEFQQ